MYIHTSFICSTLRVFSNGLLTNNSTWCQNRGCICISSTRKTYGRIHSSFLHTSRQIILWTELFSKEEERRYPRRDTSIFEVQWCFHILQRTTCNPAKFPVIPCKENYSTYRINSSTRILQEILQLQGSSHADHYKASSNDCSRASKHSTRQNKAPSSPTALQAYMALAVFQQFYPAETAF